MPKELALTRFIPGFEIEDDVVYEYRFGIFTDFVIGAVYSPSGVSFVFAGMLALDREKEWEPLHGKILAKFTSDCQDFTEARIEAADIDLKVSGGVWAASISIRDTVYDFDGETDEHSRRLGGTNKEVDNSLIDLFLLDFTSTEEDNFKLFNDVDPRIIKHGFALFMHFLCDVSLGKLAPQQ